MDKLQIGSTQKPRRNTWFLTGSTQQTQHKPAQLLLSATAGLAPAGHTSHLSRSLCICSKLRRGRRVRVGNSPCTVSSTEGCNVAGRRHKLQTEYVIKKALVASVCNAVPGLKHLEGCWAAIAGCNTHTCNKTQPASNLLHGGYCVLCSSSLLKTASQCCAIKQS